MKVLVHQIVDFCEAYEMIDRAQMSFKGLTLVDMAINHRLVTPEYRKYVKIAEMPIAISKYRQKLNELKLIHQIKIKDVFPPNGIVIADGEAYVKDARALEAEYKTEIDAYQQNLIAQRDMVDESRELNLLLIDKNSIIFKEDNPNTARMLAAFAFLFK